MSTSTFAQLCARSEAFFSSVVSSLKLIPEAARATSAATRTSRPSPATSSPCTVDERRYLYVLPVLFFEYLALSLSRALLPGLMNSAFGNYTYHVLGIVETAKGILAFMACPLFGKLSDVVGRRTGLFITVLGTTLPISSLALTQSMWIYAVAQGLSGVFASTFTITFAYIADLVHKERRSSAYGLALATFGLSYCLGPILGGFLAERFSYRAVFAVSVAQVVLAVAYIVLILPESRSTEQQRCRRGIRLLAAGMPPPGRLLAHVLEPFLRLGGLLGRASPTERQQDSLSVLHRGVGHRLHPDGARAAIFPRGRGDARGAHVRLRGLHHALRGRPRAPDGAPLRGKRGHADRPRGLRLAMRFFQLRPAHPRRPLFPPLLDLGQPCLPCRLLARLAQRASLQTGRGSGGHEWNPGSDRRLRPAPFRVPHVPLPRHQSAWSTLLVGKCVQCGGVAANEQAPERG